MKNIRVWFSKTGPSRYISHLDLMRCMTRAVRRAQLPLWYTQGFNSRVYMTFALPLSLGVSGLRESMDLRLKGEMDGEEIKNCVNRVLPPDIQVLEVTEPKMKPGAIAFASYRMRIAEEDPEELAGQIQKLFAREPLLVEKKSKHGVLQMNLHPELDHTEVAAEAKTVQIDAVLPAGSNFNLNPALLLDCIKKNLNIEITAEIICTNLYDESMKPFE